MHTQTEKYPRTYHFPFSEGALNDDRIQADWQALFAHEVVFTEKLDGENTCLKSSGVYARSHGAPNENPWARPIWDIWHNIGRSLGNLHLFGENLYAIHSIEYQHLEAYFYVFAIRDGAQWLSWEEVCAYAQVLDLPTVPELARGIFAPEDVQNLIQAHQKNGSHLTGDSEGVVCRLAGAFPLNDFPKNVLKYVRKNHVQTDEHWIRNWKKAPLWFERPNPSEQP
jgi:hypothetical protein